MAWRGLNRGSVPSQSLDVRHEIKFVSDRWKLPRVVSWMVGCAASFREVHPPRRVNNIYFDTLDLDTYEENLSGISNRTKLRFRWYGETTTPEGGVLEVKQRHNDLGTKLLIRTTGTLELEGRPWRTIIDDLRQRMSEEDGAWLRHFDRPAIINRYERQYFEGKDGLLRLTIDTNQAAYDQTKTIRPNLRNRSNLPDCAVIEVKFRPENSVYASSIVKGIPLRRSRNSKYMVGVNSTFYQY